MKQLITFTASIIVASSLTACGGGDGHGDAPKGPAAATRAQLDA
jgi:predicted small lipoprotein YifL